jgi:hypothetical protein
MDLNINNSTEDSSSDLTKVSSIGLFDFIWPNIEMVSPMSSSLTLTPIELIDPSGPYGIDDNNNNFITLTPMKSILDEMIDVEQQQQLQQMQQEQQNAESSAGNLFGSSNWSEVYSAVNWNSSDGGESHNSPHNINLNHTNHLNHHHLNNNHPHLSHHLNSHHHDETDVGDVVSIEESEEVTTLPTLMTDPLFVSFEDSMMKGGGESVIVESSSFGVQHCSVISSDLISTTYREKGGGVLDGNCGGSNSIIDGTDGIGIIGPYCEFKMLSDGTTDDDTFLPNVEQLMRTRNDPCFSSAALNYSNYNNNPSNNNSLNNSKSETMTLSAKWTYTTTNNKPNTNKTHSSGAPVKRKRYKGTSKLPQMKPTTKTVSNLNSTSTTKLKVLEASRRNSSSSSPQSPPGDSRGSVGSCSAGGRGITSTSSSSRKGRSLHYCDTCSKGFKDKHSVNVHFRTHTGEKPFACILCGKSFRQKPHLAKHHRTHYSKANHNGTNNNNGSNSSKNNNKAN